MLRLTFISKLRFDAVVSLLILRIIFKKASFEIRTAKRDAQSWIIGIETILSSTSLHIVFLIDRLSDPLSRSISISIHLIVRWWLISSLRNDVVPFGLQNFEFGIIVICSLMDFLNYSAILTHPNYLLLCFISLNFMNISVVIILLFYLVQNIFNTWATFTSSQHIRLIVVIELILILWPGLSILLFAINDLYILEAILPFQIAIELRLGRRSPLIIDIDNSLRSLFLYLHFLHQIHILLLLLFLCHFDLIILLHFLV